MKDKSSHITAYTTYGIILTILLILTFISVAATNVHLGAVTVAVALTIASVKVGIVLMYFMHLKYESRFLKFAVLGVFILFALVIIITFIDYLYR